MKYCNHLIETICSRTQHYKGRYKMKNSLNWIVTPLLKWYQKEKRILPWREDKNPYHVWISEIMLQQTRIEAVKEYYALFMKELPDVKSLAEVSEERLLKLWEGLGYYSRARNLKKSASIIMREYHGDFPKQYQELIKLPGIGEYTAGAISSICFQEKQTAVDGNVLRVISRVMGSRKDVLLPETKKEVEKMLIAVMPKESGDFNEGLMELGETICLPSGTPLCEKCPLQKDCIAYQQNLTVEIPVRVKKIKRTKAEKTILIMINEEGKIAIEKRIEKGLLSGMYQFPNFDGFLEEKEIKQKLRQANIIVKKMQFLKETKHVFTHVDWYMKSYQISVKDQNQNYLWVSQEELINQYALPTAFQKAMKIE